MPYERRPELQNRVQEMRAGTNSMTELTFDEIESVSGGSFFLTPLGMAGVAGATFAGGMVALRFGLGFVTITGYASVGGPVFVGAVAVGGLALWLLSQDDEK